MLITEDGSGKADAESLCSVADADVYHLSFGNDDWQHLPLLVKEQSLRRATAYMAGEYGNQLGGSRKTETQALDWPRVYVPIQHLTYLSYYPDSSVPGNVKQACASLALRSTSAELVADEERPEVRVKVGEIEVEYDPYSPLAVKYKEIDRLLAPYLKVGAGGCNVPMVRI